MQAHAGGASLFDMCDILTAGGTGGCGPAAVGSVGVADAAAAAAGVVCLLGNGLPCDGDGAAPQPPPPLTALRSEDLKGMKEMTEPPLRERERERERERADEGIASLGELFLDVSSAQAGERAEERAEREERGERSTAGQHLAYQQLSPPSAPSAPSPLSPSPGAPLAAQQVVAAVAATAYEEAFEHDVAAAYQLMESMSLALIRVLCQLAQLDEDRVARMCASDVSNHLSSQGHAAAGSNAVTFGGTEKEGAEKAPFQRDPYGFQILPVGSNVFRVYQYLRPKGSALPGLKDPGTGIHADMGLVTLSVASMAGLTVLSPDAVHWMDVEASHADGGGGSAGRQRRGSGKRLPEPGLGYKMTAIRAVSGSPSSSKNEILSMLSGAAGASILLTNADVPPYADVPPDSGCCQVLDRFVFMCGETLGRLTKGRLRAPLHYVDEREMGRARISMPFFTRCSPQAKLGDERGIMTVADFMEQVVTTSRPWVAPTPPPGKRRDSTGCFSALMRRVSFGPAVPQEGTIQRPGRDY